VNVQLPPERELHEPNRMVGRILEQTRHDPPRRWLRIMPAMSFAVGAATTITALALGIMTASPDRPEVGQPPSATATPQPPSPAMPQATTAVGTTVTFPDLAVTVHSANQIRVNNRPADEYTIFVTTCLRRLPSGTSADRARLRAKSFTLNTDSATITIEEPIPSPVPLPTTYPADGNYKVGQCVSGVIPFGVDHRSTVVSIDYADSFGDATSWIP